VAVAQRGRAAVVGSITLAIGVVSPSDVAAEHRLPYRSSIGDAWVGVPNEGRKRAERSPIPQAYSAVWPLAMLREIDPGIAAQQRLALGDFVLDLARGELLDAQGHPADLRAQALRVLLVLGERAGQVVGKDELLRAVWGGVVVTEDSLVQAIGDIRRLLGAAGHEVLRTVPRRGYLLNLVQAADAPRAGDTSPNAPAVPAATVPSRRRGWMVAAAALGAVLLVLVATVLQRDVPAPARSLAILPFESEQPAADDAWFVDAVTSDLNTMVARWGAGLQVIGRGTMQAYKGQAADPREVGRRLGVAHVLSGRVRREGDRVRIAVELVDTQTGQVMWARPFDVDRRELPGSVGDIAGGIAKALNIELGDVVTRNGERLDRLQADADDFAMRGFSVFLKRLGPESFEQARQLFEQALARDPKSMRALAGVSLTNSMNVSFNYTNDQEGSMRRSQEALARLEAIDPQAHLTLVSRASVRLSSNDWLGQLAVAEELVRNFPNDPTSHHHRCSAMLRLGRFDEAIPACERAIRISPNESRTPIWQGLIAMNEFMRGNYGAAAERARITATANANVPFYALLVAVALARDGRHAEAQRLADEFKARHPSFGIASIEAGWRVTNAHPGFAAGRDRIVSTARELGLR
jgi:TolB-like protein/DNA-binding winged helix-turn-helix (wHTH) protein